MVVSFLVSAAVLLMGLAGAGGEVVVNEDFSGRSPGKDWKVSNGAWKVANGELLGAGEGYLEFKSPLPADFVLTFEAMTEEKANVEVHLVDRRGKAVFAFAFLGRYHPVLDGVKCCLLKNNTFVSVNSRMWIFPGRKFLFEVRRARNQYQMFLNRELGPFFLDPAPPENLEDLRLRITYAPEGKRDKVHIDNIRIVAEK